MSLPGNDLKERVEFFSDYDYQIKVAGVKFRQSELGELYGEDWNELRVVLQPEPENKYDPNAIAIYAGIEGPIQMGYLPAMVAPHLLSNMNDGKEYTCALVYITSGNRGKIRTAKIALKEK